MVTADHGGQGTGHSTARQATPTTGSPSWSGVAGVPAGADLYSLNPTYADPGTARPGYAAARQPIRNGDVGNLVLDVLGLPPDPGQRARPGQDLESSATS